MMLLGLLMSASLAAAERPAAAEDEVARDFECAAYYQHVSALMEMSSTSKNKDADPAYLAKTAQSMTAYQERAKALMIRAGQMQPSDRDLPKVVLDREEELFSDLMTGKSTMDAVVRVIGRCNRTYGFQDIP